MQTLNIDGTTYHVKFDRDPLELAKLARKPWKPKKPKELIKFPDWLPNMSTAEYIRRFDSLNCRVPVKYDGASDDSAAQYDPTMPVFEVLDDAVAA